MTGRHAYADCPVLTARSLLKPPQLAGGVNCWEGQTCSQPCLPKSDLNKPFLYSERGGGSTGDDPTLTYFYEISEYPKQKEDPAKKQKTRPLVKDEELDRIYPKFYQQCLMAEERGAISQVLRVV